MTLDTAKAIQQILNTVGYAPFAPRQAGVLRAVCCELVIDGAARIERINSDGEVIFRLFA